MAKGEDMTEPLTPCPGCGATNEVDPRDLDNTPGIMFSPYTSRYVCLCQWQGPAADVFDVRTAKRVGPAKRKKQARELWNARAPNEQGRPTHNTRAPGHDFKRQDAEAILFERGATSVTIINGNANDATPLVKWKGGPTEDEIRKLFPVTVRIRREI